MRAEIGILMGFLSAILNGSYCVPSKMSSVRKKNVHPVVFNLYVCIGIFLGSISIYPFLEWNHYLIPGASAEFQFSWFGILSGIVFVFSNTFAFAAINNIGLSIAQGIWSGLAALVSFLWGRFVFGNILSHPYAAYCGVVILVLGTVGVACSEQAGKLCEAEVESIHEAEEMGLLIPHGKIKTRRQRIKGIAYAIVVGLCGGSLLVPIKFSHRDAQGLGFIPSFGIGALFFGILFTIAFFGIRKEIPYLFILDTCLPGVLAGIIWSLSNICSVVSVFTIGYAVGYTLMQCALFVSGWWGILYFHEIQGVAVQFFIFSGCIVVIGACLLVYAAPHV